MEILPLVPGFKFECQRCGACCQAIDRPLTLDELTYFNNHHMPVKWMFSRNEKGEVVSIYPCKPGGVMCSACDQKNTCLIYDDRPVGCRLYPFIFRLYYRRPPNYEEIVRSLGHVPPVGTIRHFIHQLDEGRWMFVGCPQTPSCPGVGAGQPWSKRQIKKFISDNLSMFARAREQMDETTQVLMNHIEPEMGGVERWFEEERCDITPDGLKISVCRTRVQPADTLFGNLVMTTPLRVITTVPPGMLGK